MSVKNASPAATVRVRVPASVPVPELSAIVTLVESSELESITSVKGWGGLDLSGLNVLQDTASLVFTKQ